LQAIRKGEPSAITIRIPQHYNQCCGAGVVSRGAKIKFPPRAGAEITNCGSGFFLFIKDNKFYGKKSLLFEEVFVNYYNFKPIWVQRALIHVKMYWFSSQKGTLVP
jgi:hypothetical protein